MSHHEAAASIVAAARTSLPDLVERVVRRIRAIQSDDLVEVELLERDVRRQNAVPIPVSELESSTRSGAICGMNHFV